MKLTARTTPPPPRPPPASFMNIFTGINSRGFRQILRKEKFMLRFGFSDFVASRHFGEALKRAEPVYCFEYFADSYIRSLKVAGFFRRADTSEFNKS